MKNGNSVIQVTDQGSSPPVAAWGGTFGPPPASQVAGGIPVQAQTDDVTLPSALLMRILVRPFVYRHPRAWGGLEAAVGLWLIILGAILCSADFWWEPC